MRLRLAFVAVALCSAAHSAAAHAAINAPPLKNPAVLNIGFVCHWQDRCIDQQRDAMGRALNYVAKVQPAAWKIQLCNRNAGRNGTRVDWIGFNNCVRNPDLRPSPPKARKRRR